MNPAALGLMAGALLTLRFRSPLRQKLDQLFFREAYDRERVLLALIEKVDRLDSKRNEQVRVKVLDFGLAKLRPLNLEHAETVSVAGVVAGTFGSMAPQQLLGREVDERADLFALGIMAVEALTGRRPFDRSTYAETLAAMHYEPFRWRSKQPCSLGAVLERCLAANVEDRFASVIALRAELIPALRNLEPEWDRHMDGTSATSASDRTNT